MNGTKGQRGIKYMDNGVLVMYMDRKKVKMFMYDDCTGIKINRKKNKLSFATTDDNEFWSRTIVSIDTSVSKETYKRNYKDLCNVYKTIVTKWYEFRCTTKLSVLNGMSDKLNQILYMPNGPMYQQAKERFESNANGQSQEPVQPQPSQQASELIIHDYKKVGKCKGRE